MMSEEANAGSNPAATTSEPVQSTEAAQVPATSPAAAPEKPAAPPSARQAIENAMAAVSKPVEAQIEKPDRSRTPDGKFAPKAAEAAEQKPVDVKPVEAAIQTTIGPPARFTKQAQTDWATAPESIRTEVVRLEKELTQGIEKYRADAEAFEPLRQYHELAKQHGTNMADALGNYVKFDNMWAGDPVQAFFETCRATRHDPRAVLQAIVNGGQMQQPGPDPRDGLIQQQAQKIAQLEQKFGGLEQTVQQSQQKQVYEQTLAQVEGFAKDKPYFTELLPTINQIVETKFATDLSDAYDKAVRLNPEIAAKIAADKAPKQPASNAKAALSITGTPQGGSNPTAKPSGSAREALQKALAQVNAA